MVKLGKGLWDDPANVPPELEASAATGLVATGTVITDALNLTSGSNEFTTVASGTGAQLGDISIGGSVLVRNGGANALKVYPHSATGLINGGTAGASVSIAAAALALFVRVSELRWIASESPAA